jgi:hypothetical protein
MEGRKFLTPTGLDAKYGVFRLTVSHHGTVFRPRMNVILPRVQDSVTFIPHHEDMSGGGGKYARILILELKCK